MAGRMLWVLVVLLGVVAVVHGERPTPPPAPDFAGLEAVDVVSVIDGDTIRVRVAEESTEVVRLVGVQAPEGIAAYGRESSIWLHDLLDGESVYLIGKENETHDAYNRRLAYVYRDDGLFINLELIRQGQAKSYRRFPCRFTEQFNAWEAYARAHHKGLWRQ